MRELESPSARRVWLCGAGIALAALAAYANTFSTPFHFDDVPTIHDNPTIRHLASAWRTPMDGSTTTGRPVLNLAFAANYAAGGLSVFGYHVVNLAIHVAAGLLLFGIVRRTLARPRAGRGETGDSATLIAFGAALLWTLHPLQTEAVTYIAQRAESLMGLFYLLTLYCFVRGAEVGTGRDPSGSELRNSQSGRQDRRSSGSRPEAANELRYSPEGSLPVPTSSRVQRVWLGLSWAACLLGMGTKEVMVSAPVIVFLYDRTFVAGSFREAWRRSRYYCCLASTWLPLAALVYFAQSRGGTAGFNVGVSVWKYWPTQAPAIVAYLRLSVLPIRQIFDYGTQWVGNLWKILPDAVIVVALAAASVTALFRRRSALGFLGVFFFCILAPTSVVPGDRQTMAEHRMYLALAALTVAGAVGLEAGCRRWFGPRKGGRAFVWTVLAAAFVFGFLTIRRNALYRTDVALWSDTVAKLPESPYARNNVGVALFGVGRLQEADAQYQEAIRLKPDYAEAYNNWGNTLMGEGRLDQALEEFSTALKKKPDYADAYSNLGIALAKEGRNREAIADFEEAVRRNPHDARYFSNLGKTLAQMGSADEAIAAYQSAVQCDPDDPGFHFGLGNVLDRSGHLDEALKEYEEALRLNPDYADAHNNLGGIYARRGRIPEALAQFEAAVRLEPQNPGFRVNLGNGLAQSGKTAEAIEQYREALRLRPDYEQARAMIVRLLSAEPR